MCRGVPARPRSMHAPTARRPRAPTSYDRHTRADPPIVAARTFRRQDHGGRPRVRRSQPIERKCARHDVALHGCAGMANRTTRARLRSGMRRKLGRPALAACPLSRDSHDLPSAVDAQNKEGPDQRPDEASHAAIGRSPVTSCSDGLFAVTMRRTRTSCRWREAGDASRSPCQGT